jgi:AcrR family transcriptional regulator
MQEPTEPKPRWERRKDARPQELLAAALDLFVGRGYAATRLEDVARRAGVSKGTLYLYFANKEELFKAVVRDAIVQPIGEAETDFAAVEGHSADLLRTLLMRWWDKVGATRASGITKLMIAEAANFPELMQFYNEEVIARGNALISGILARGVARGEFRPLDPAVMMPVLTAPVLMLMLWSQSPQLCAGAEIDPRAYLAAFIDNTLRGLRPSGVAEGAPYTMPPPPDTELHNK